MTSKNATPVIVAMPVNSRKRPVRAGPQERSSATRTAAILRLDVAPASRTQPALGNSAIIVRVARATGGPRASGEQQVDGRRGVEDDPPFSAPPR